MTVRAPIIGTNTDSAETFRLALGGLWVQASALNARTGVTSVPVLTGTGNFTATVGAFTAVVDGTSNSLQGSYPVAVDVATTVTVTAANTQARIDLICLQVQDNAYDGSGFSRGIPVVVAGTPSGSPVAPATPANAIPLWTVPVAANATSIVFTSATAVFPYTAAAGGIVPVRGATDKPATVNGVAYRHRLDVGAGGVSPLEWSTDGTTYNPVTSGIQKIGSVIVSGSAVPDMTIAVPAGYSALFGITSQRGDVAVGGANLQMQFNGDTGINYVYQNLGISNAGSPSGANANSNVIYFGLAPAAGGTANYFGSSNFTVPNPGSAGFKSVNGSTLYANALNNSGIGIHGGVWLSTAAITSIKIFVQASNLVAGSSFTLYGLL